jgi:hypothetical protein
MYVMFTKRREESSEPKVTDVIKFLLGGKKHIFKTSFNGLDLLKQLTDLAFSLVALLLICHTKISFTKASFNHPSVKESPLRLPPL